MIQLDNWVISRLSEPFEAHEVRWRPGAANSFLAYIDARQVVERLNQVVGAENWEDNYTPIEFRNTEIKETTNIAELKAKAVEEKWNISDNFWVNKMGEITSLKNKAYATYSYNHVHFGGIKCSLTVLNVNKEDVGTPSLADHMKGAHSDALKRAAVKFGIGAYLYDLKNIKGGYIERGIVVEAPELPDWALPTPRGNPDDAILSLFEQAKANSNCHPVMLEKIFSKISVMGNYNTFAPLVTKRMVYEELLMFIKNSDGSSALPKTHV
jgi:hypothetical protein